MESYKKPFRKSKGLWLIIGLTFFPTVSPVFSQTVTEERIRQESAKLTKLKDEIARWEKDIAENKEKEQSTLTRLEKIERRLEIMHKELEIYDWNLKVAEKKEKELDGLSKQTSSQLQLKKSLLEKKLRGIYKISQYPGPILSPDRNSFLLKRYLRVSIFSDMQSIALEEKAQKSTFEKQMALKKRQERIRLYKERVLKQRNVIEQEKTAKEQLLASIKDKKYIYEKTQKELEEASKKLSDLVNILQGQNKKEFTARDFMAGKGQLSWPVKGEITSLFGRVKHPRFNYYTFNKGIAIKAELDSTVRAIGPGKILFVDWLRGYGKMVIVDHGGGYYSLYAHLSQIFVGVGDIIGKDHPVATLGDSGSLVGPSLYFEIRHHGKPENPLHWLAKNP